jgi:MFS family permease
MYFAAFFGFSILIPVMPLYTSHLGASISQVGLIVSIFSYVPAFLMIPFGILADRFEKRTFMIMGLTILTLAPILYLFVTTPDQLILVRIVHGFGPAMLVPASVSTVANLAQSDHRGESLGWMTTASQAGLMVGPLTGGFLLNSFDFNAAFYACTIGSVIGLAMVLFRFGNFSSRSVDMTAKRSWGWIKQRWIFAALIVPTVLAAGYGSTGTYIPLHGLDLSINEAGAGIIIACSFASSAVLRVPVGRLADRIGTKGLILAGLALSGITMTGFALFTNLWQLIIVAILFGIGSGTATISTLLRLTSSAPPSGRGLASGAFTSFFQIGLALGTTAMGYIADARGFVFMFYITALCIIIGLLVIISLTLGRK